MNAGLWTAHARRDSLQRNWQKDFQIMRGLYFAVLSLGLIFASLPAYAVSLIRDAEMEQALRQIARPVLQAAGLGAGRIRILVIKDNSLNAFVTDSRHIFIHSGLILKLKTPEMLQAVIAHEVAHIANGHITRRAGNARAATRLSAVGFALAAAAAAAGEGRAGAGLAVGVQSSAQRLFFAHTRAEEASADQSGLRYMARAGIDPSAMGEVMEIFRGQEALRPGRQDPYAVTHPLSRDRLRAIKGFIAGHKSATSKRSATMNYWYARMDAKLQGFLRNPRYVLRRKEAKGASETATLRRAVAYHRKPDPKRALAEIDKLIGLRPGDAFYHELKGQILLESGRPKAAIASYQTATSLAPKEALILGGLGRAYLALNTKAGYKKALSVLSKARDRDPGDPSTLRSLAVAHAKTGQSGLASVATAERYAILGQFSNAKTHASRASGQLPRGSSGWLRAQDVLNVAELGLSRGKKRR